MNTPFIPIQGKRNIIDAQAIIPGNLYFATDTGEMFLDTDTERIPVGGGGVAVLYAVASSVSQDLTDLSYVIYFDDLEDQQAVPKKDDLIINSNGTFYKVRSYNKSSGVIKCSRIAVSGTGGGGGGTDVPGGDQPGDNKYVKLVCVSIAPNAQTYIYKQSQYIEFKVEASHDAIVNLNYLVTNVASGNTVSYPFTVRTGGTHRFDLGSILEKGQNTLSVEAIGSNSGQSVLQYSSINCIELALKPSNNFNALDIAHDEDMTFNFIPVGTVRKTLNVYIDDNLEVTKELLATDNEQSMSVTIPKKAHGVYNLRAELAYNTGATTITTDPLEYQIAFAERDNEAPLIWFSDVPEKIVDHDKLNIQYMVYDPKSQARTTVRRYINNNEIASLENVAYSSTQWLNWNVSNYQLGENIFALQCGTTTAEVKVIVEEDELRDLNILTTDLYLNLTTVGRSNAENETSRQTWEYLRSNGEKSIVKFNNFNWYNNGWLDDLETGDSILRISNGASIEIPVSVMNTDVLSTNLTFELQFKLRNVQKYENLIEITSIEDEDGNVIVNKKVKSTDGVWCNYYGNSIGMCLGTQEGFFKSSQSIASGRYKEEEIVTVSFVIEKAADTNQYPLIYMYINGIMSGIVNYDKNTDKFGSGVKKMVINSDYCDVDIYKIRIYRAALSSADIVHNYIADQNSAELYDMNQIIEFKNNIPTISYTKMVDYNSLHPDKLLQPYAILECVDQTDDRLPYVKGGKKNLNVTFVNPALDKAYNDGDITGEQYIMGCPSYRAENIPFDVQGTSSQGYPRRNYKGKFKKKDDNSWVYTNGPLKDKQIGEKNTYNDVKYKGYYMDNHYSETSFTWKADYMESSMTHNTGFASFVKTLYSKHPLQDYDENIDVTDRRTTVYGFPMIVFQKKADGSYEFIGRYNYNLDKSCNNVIGFEDETQHPYVEGTFMDGDEEKPLDFAHVAECWELLNNQGGRTSFTVTNFEETDETGQLTVLNDFEYRYHIDEDAIDAAIDHVDDFANQTQDEINRFLLEKYANLRAVAEWLQSTDSIRPTNQPLDAPYESGGVTYTEDTADYRLAKFAKEFTEHFDTEYCAIYFIMTELLLQYDSRGKNMMLATWGPKKLGGHYIWYPIFYDIDTQLGVNNSGVPSWEYDTEPSPITGSGVFSTANSVLWYNFEKMFMPTIQTTYQNLRKELLTYEKLKGYYDYNPEVSHSYAMMGARPVNIINVDEYWKYIAPTFTGYINTSGTISHDEGKRFYCLQGTRQLHRDLFLRNRFNYVDSKWSGHSYEYTGAISQLQIRCNANYPETTSDKYLDRVLTSEDIGFEQANYPQPLDANFTFEVTPYLHQYNSLWFDKTMIVYPQPWDGEGPNVLELPSATQDAVKTQKALTQQLFYIGGGEYISSLGDLSLKYPDELYLTALKRLKDVHLGNDTEGYVNNGLSTFVLGAGAKNPDGTPNENTKALLEQVVLTNVGSLSSAIDVTGAEKLKEFRALGTNITGVSFADGGQMEIVHLPNTVVHITFTQPTRLKGLITSGDNLKDENGKFLPGLYIPGVTTSNNLTDSTPIETLKIVGGDMGYSSYNLMKNLVTIKQTMQGTTSPTDVKKSIAISLEKVLWSPYKLVESGVALDNNKTYVLKTDNSTFESYSPTAANWTQNTLNGLVYEVLPDANAEKDCLTDLSLINLFTDINGNLSSSENNYFKDTIERADGGVTYPYLSGDIFVNNPESEPISEFDIKEIVNNYYPDLHIFVAHVDPAYTLKLVEVIDDEVAGTEQTIELQTIKYDKSSTTPIKMSDIKVTPSRLHHYFKGWSLSKNGEILTNEQIESLTFSADKMTYILYAVFDWDSYVAYFYNGDEQVGQTDPVIYGNYFYEIPVVPDRAEDEAQLPLVERIAFYGWSDKYQTNPIVESEDAAKQLIVDVTSYKSTENKAFYAVFIKENVYDKPTDDKYFTYLGPITVEGVTGYQICGNTDFTLTGKITIPKEHDGMPIVSIGSFLNALDATGIFFMDNILLKEVGDRAFNTDRYETKLVGIYLPDTVVRIGNYAFQNVSSLEHISDHYPKNNVEGDVPPEIKFIGDRAFAMNLTTGKLRINALPSTLTKLGSQNNGERTFYQCGPNVHISELPVNIPATGFFTFSDCPNIYVAYFGSKTGDMATTPLEVIGTRAFQQIHPGAHSAIETIYVWDSVKTINEAAFNGYGKRNADGTSALVLQTNHLESEVDWNAAKIGVQRIEYGYKGE